jgi:hypothetical protein
MMPRPRGYTEIMPSLAITAKQTRFAGFKQSVRRKVMSMVEEAAIQVGESMDSKLGEDQTQAMW